MVKMITLFSVSGLISAPAYSVLSKMRYLGLGGTLKVKELDCVCIVDSSFLAGVVLISESLTFCLSINICITARAGVGGQNVTSGEKVALSYYQRGITWEC